jgi:hypothetical protein
MAHSNQKARCSLTDLESESTEDVQVTEIANESRTDVEGLLTYLQSLQFKNSRLDEVVFCGNMWYWSGIVPFEHYGFIIPTSNNGEYLGLDFGRSGLVWEIFDDYPDYPDGTFLVQRYHCSASRPWHTIAEYCKETQPFNYFTNDCKSWSEGLRQALNLDLVQSSSAKQKPQHRRSQHHILGGMRCM